MTDISNGTYDQFFISLLALDAYNRGDFVNVQLRDGLTNVGGAILRSDDSGGTRLGANLTSEELTEYLGENNFALLDADQVGFNAVGHSWIILPLHP